MKIKLVIKAANLAKSCDVHLVEKPKENEHRLVIGETVANQEFKIKQDNVDGTVFDLDDDNEYGLRFVFRNQNNDVLFTPEFVPVYADALPMSIALRCANVTIEKAC